MKALSIHGNYADAIARGKKRIEYRSWKTDYRGDLLICASTYGQTKRPGLYVTGRAVCVVTLAAIKGEQGDYRWILKDVRMVEPVAIKGKLHIYDVDDDDIKYTGQDYETARAAWIAAGLVSDTALP